MSLDILDILSSLEGFGGDGAGPSPDVGSSGLDLFDILSPFDEFGDDGSVSPPPVRRTVPFSSLMFRDRVRLYALTDGIDDGGGKTSEYVAAGDALPCRVTRLASRAKDLADVTETETQFELSFPARPGGRKGDQFAWLDPDDPTAELTRIAVTEAATPRDPRGRLWIAYGVVVQ